MKAGGQALSQLAQSFRANKIRRHPVAVSDRRSAKAVCSKQQYRTENRRKQGITINAKGTLVRVEPDGFGVVEISPKKQGRNFGYFTERVKLHGLTLVGLRQGVRQGLKFDLKARDLGTEVLQVISIRLTRNGRQDLKKAGMGDVAAHTGPIHGKI